MSFEALAHSLAVAALETIATGALFQCMSDPDDQLKQS